MKEGIHPNTRHPRSLVTVVTAFETKSTKGDITTEICSSCHPFYTGKQKLMDTAGRIERFRKMYEKKD